MCHNKMMRTLGFSVFVGQLGQWSYQKTIALTSWASSAKNDSIYSRSILSHLQLLWCHSHRTRILQDLWSAWLHRSSNDLVICFDLVDSSRPRSTPQRSSAWRHWARHCKRSWRRHCQWDHGIGDDVWSGICPSPPWNPWWRCLAVPTPLQHSGSAAGLPSTSCLVAGRDNNANLQMTKRLRIPLLVMKMMKTKPKIGEKNHIQTYANQAC